MTTEHPFVLFIGHPDSGKALHQALDALRGYVYHAEEMMEALAMYTFYQPDVVVIDVSHAPEISGVTFKHLDSVCAKPIVLIADRQHLTDWELMPHPSTTFVPTNAPVESLIASIQQVLHAQETAFL